MRRRGVGRVGRPSLIGTAARTAVIAGTATAVSGKVAAGQQASARSQPAAVAAPPPPPAAAAAAPSGVTDETIEQLKKLAELKDAGILSEDEFTAKKAQVLGLS